MVEQNAIIRSFVSFVGDTRQYPTECAYDKILREVVEVSSLYYLKNFFTTCTGPYAVYMCRDQSYRVGTCRTGIIINTLFTLRTST